MPVVFALQDDPAFRRMIDKWIEIRKSDGTVSRLYDYWILGRMPDQRRKPRWSVIRDVLGWIE